MLTLKNKGMRKRGERELQTNRLNFCTLRVERDFQCQEVAVVRHKKYG